jgi:hypothetical protein
MKCEPTLTNHSFKDLHNTDIIRILKKERNDFAKSRQQWIQAAYDMVYHDDETLFFNLEKEELCDKCKMSYAKNLI